jgi:hypothetical protein
MRKGNLAFVSGPVGDGCPRKSRAKHFEGEALRKNVLRKKIGKKIISWFSCVT